MQAILGVWAKTPSVNAAAIIQRLAAAMQPHEKMQTVSAGARNVVFAYYADAINATRSNDQIFKSGDELAAWDARWDDPHPPKSSTSRIATFLSVYRQLGIDCFDTLYGDFAIAVWDPKSRNLVLARDPVGVRTIYYLDSPSFCAFSTQLRSLTVLAETRELNRLYFAAYLTGTESAPGMSPFKAIAAIPPGHSVVITESSLVARPYWNVPVSGRDETRRLTKADAAHEVGILLTNAVKRRVSSGTWSELSGGIDSAAIVSTVKVLADQGYFPCRELNTLTVWFPSTPSANERPFAESVVRSCGFPAHWIDGEKGYFQSIQQAAEYWDEPNGALLNYGTMRSYVETFRRNNCVALLNGMGAEATLTAEPAAAYDLTDVGNVGLARLRRGAVRWRSSARRPWANLVCDYALSPLLRRFRGRAVTAPPTFAPWFSPDSNLRGAVLNVLTKQDWPGPNASLADLAHRQRIGRVCHALTRGPVERAVEMRYPFLDRRLVEFCLGLPWSIKTEPGVKKPLLYEACRNLVPREISQRSVRTRVAQVIYDSLDRNASDVESLFDNSVLAELGLINPAQAKRALALARFGHSADLPQILGTITAELWLRAHASSSTTELERVANA